MFIQVLAKLQEEDAEFFQDLWAGKEDNAVFIHGQWGSEEQEAFLGKSTEMCSLY